jgi:hypothetical protein
MNTYQMENPEAFTAEYEEEQQVLADIAAGLYDDEPEVEGDLCDIVREHEESMTEEEIETYQRQILRFDDPYDMG